MSRGAVTLPPIRTAGIDLAAQPRDTGAVVVDWTEDPPVGRVLADRTLDDDELLDLFARADKVGIDAPFGWPVTFVDAITNHHRGLRWPDIDRRVLRLRRTDFFVHRRTQIWPMSVSSNLIGVVAMRCALLQSRWRERSNTQVDRVGRHRLVEVYPRAALKLWGFRDTRYKNDPAVLHELASSLLQAAGVRFGDPDREQLGDDHNAFDAFVAALVARLAAAGLTERSPPEDADAAGLEGWIHLPTAGPA